jgi:hypothetical protein
MPGMTKEYCKSTPINKMGFSQRSSCKALGIIPRTSKAHFGKKIVSNKYKSRSRSRSRSRSVKKEGSRKLRSLRRSRKIEKISRK